MNTRTFLGGAAAMLLIVPSWASAIVLYDDTGGLGTGRAAWEAAVGSFQDVDLASQVAEFGILGAGDPLALPYDEEVTFDIDLEGRQVPGSWTTWSGGETPRVLYTQGEDVVIATFDGPVGAFGLEMEPDLFQTYTMGLFLADGGILEFVVQPVDGDSGAAFFGWSDGGVVAMALACDGCGGFAFGRMVKSEVVPEPAIIGLLGLGLLGVGFARKRNRD